MTVRPHNPCADCGACCRSYIVPVSGYDIWQISTQERLNPDEFLVPCQQGEPALDGFRLEAGGAAYGLALDKSGDFAVAQPCVFLVQMEDGQDRCGIYAHRPDVCRGYPMFIWSGVVAQRSESICPPGSWPLPVVRRPAWRGALQSFYMHMDVYLAVIARWNAWVDSRPDVRFLLPEFYSYLLNVYDGLARLDTTYGEEAIAAIRATWPTVPRPDGDPAAVYGPANRVPWLAYFTQARALINGYFPAVPPQTDLRLAVTY